MWRFAVGSLACIILAAPISAEDAPSKPIPPVEAKNHVGKKVTVEMTVKAAKKSGKFKRVFLDSMENFQDPDNLGVAITESAEVELARKHATSDIAAFFRDNQIRVTGTIER